MSLKTCSRCGETKPQVEFYVDRRKPDGRKHSCASCDRTRSLAYHHSNYRERLQPRVLEYSKRTYWADPDTARERSKAYKRANPEVSEAWEAAHPQRHVEYRHRNLEAVRARDRALKKAKPEYRRKAASQRRATELRATPAWANERAILAIFSAAAECERITGEIWHVDHVVPLRHPLVCGLHCEANLCPIPARDNRAKGNRYWPDMPE